MRARIVFCSLFFSSIVGCSASTSPAPADDVVLMPAKSVYTAGQTVAVQLSNRSVDPIGYGACSLRLEYREASRWVLIGPEQVPCVLILYVVPPASARSLELPLPADLTPGTYRLRQEILPRTSLPSRTIYSPEFRLQSAS